MTRSNPRYQPGDRIGGRYQVHKALTGGMGEVYLCLDLEQNYPYALKTFQQRYQSTALRQAFEQEVATWVALEKHPNIVRCFYMDILDNQPFMVLEWIAGEEGKGADLRGWLRHGPLDLKTALEITIDVVRGLIHAQEKQPGLVHRDLKPENILVAQGGLAKITDFGLAQIVQSAGLEIEGEADGRQSMVGKGGIAGTPAYMAPEQWRGEPLDERTDIYAVGCILYELLTEQWPFWVDFTPTTPQQWKQWLIAMQSNHESRLPPELPVAPAMQISELVVGCLAKIPARRPASLTTLLVEITSIYQQQFASSPRPEQDSEQFTSGDYTNRGMTYSHLQQYEEALTDYGRAIELDPTNVYAYLNRANTYAEMQIYDGALEDYGRTIELEPTFTSAYCNRGATYHALQQYDKALKDYSQAVKLNLSFAPAYLNRGNTYNTLQQHDKALADYGRAVELDPTDVSVYCNRGNLLAKLQQYREALVDHGRAIELDPNDPENYCNRGNVYFALEQYDEAFVDYGCAIELNPLLAQAYSGRGTIFFQLQRYDEALADCHRAIKLSPTEAQFYFNRGHIYEKLQQNELALSDYSRAIEIDATLARPFRHRGFIFGQLQRHDEALADLKRAIELDPNDAKVLVSIGLAFSEQGKFAEATPYLEKATRIGDFRIRQLASEIRQQFGSGATSSVSSSQQAWEAFQQVHSLTMMRQAVAHLPFMAQADFIAAIQQVIVQQVPPPHRPHFEQRLAWLKQIAKEQTQ